LDQALSGEHFVVVAERKHRPEVTPMEQERLEELEGKRFEEGLTHDEAHELGKMMADKEGKPYSSHDDRAEDEQEPMAWDEAAKRGEESAQGEEASRVPSDDHEPEEERPVGTERQAVPPGGAGYLPPKGSDEPSP
jgi:hypothetical protein